MPVQTAAILQRDKLAPALDAASRGFWVSPVLPWPLGEAGSEGKTPAVKFKEWATRDPEKIKAWWSRTEPKTNKKYGEYVPAECNIGIYTGKFAEDKALLVVDVDCKKGKDGNAELLRLELDDKDLPHTAETKTPNRGRHILLVVDEARKQGTDTLGEGIDTRSAGGFIVAPGSTLGPDMPPYQWANDLPPATAPQWVLDMTGAQSERAPSAASISNVNIDAERAKRRAIEYLQTAPTAVEGEAGDQGTFKVAARIKDLGIADESLALTLLLEHWNDRCAPPWAADDLAEKIRNAYAYSRDPIGAAAPESDFQSIEPDAPGEKREKSYLEKINEDHALICVEGSYFIMHETVDEKGAPRSVFFNEAAFKTKFKPQTVTVGRRTVTQAESWLEWPGRREHPGLCFAPGLEPKNGYYNLWRGFTVPPIAYADASDKARAGFDLFFDHIKVNVCRGDAALAQWLTGYFAHMIQRPWERPLTTLVFRGGKGVGKNALVERVGRLLGPHFLVAHDTRYLTGQFNGHMDSCLCLVLDEAFWSGDKAADGKLKGLTTAPQILIERKGKEAYMVDNLVRLVIMGNAEHLVPASADERRYAVFDVGDGRKQDLAYFDRMRRLMDDEGGASVLLDHLMQFDLGSVNVNQAPDTAALLDQKIADLPLFGQFWLDCLAEGALLHLGDGSSGWPAQVERPRLRDAFDRYRKARNANTRGDSGVAIGKRLRKYLGPHGTGDGEWTRQGRFYKLPTLAEARAAWDAHIGRPYEWTTC